MDIYNRVEKAKNRTNTITVKKVKKLNPSKLNENIKTAQEIIDAAGLSYSVKELIYDANGEVVAILKNTNQIHLLTSSELKKVEKVMKELI